MNSGHYISDVYDLKKKCWYSYDDSHVSKISEADVKSRRERSGYIFFYMSKLVSTCSSVDHVTYLSQSNTLTWSCDIPQPIRHTQLIMWHTSPSQTLLVMWHILANQTDCSIICMKYVFGWILGSFTLQGPISLGLFVLAISFRKKLTAFIFKWYTFLQ